jgi:MFS superfamily sulfate permease-like transporter
MASFYLPMALSYASNLAHVPPINGLYSFVFNPIIYAILGSCPQMVVGPEAAGSLLVGSVVRSSVDNGKTGEGDDEMHARVVSSHFPGASFPTSQYLASCLLPRHVLIAGGLEATFWTLKSTLLGNTNTRFWGLGWCCHWYGRSHNLHRWTHAAGVLG